MAQVPVCLVKEVILSKINIFLNTFPHNNKSAIFVGSRSRQRPVCLASDL